MQNPQTSDRTLDDRQEHDPERASSDGAFSPGEAGAGGAFGDVAILFALIGASVRDATRLLGLETRLVVRTIAIMMVLGMVLALVMLGVWLSITLVIAAGLYEYTRLGLTLSIIAASLGNVACAVALVLLLKRLARRLAFPQTRHAARKLLDEASRAMHQQE